MSTRAGVLRRALRPFASRFLWVALYFVALFLVGMTGYVLIEGWGWFEAFYMAVTASTSVGFMEVYPLSRAGRAFTMVIVVLGLTGLGLWWGLTTALIVEMDLMGLLRRRRMTRTIAALENHYIICGVGRMGRVVAEEIWHSGSSLVLIERDQERLDAFLAEVPDALVLHEDATREATLVEAGIERARGLAACLSDDADNLLLCLTARGLRKDMPIVARADDEETLGKLRRAGADHTISPTVTGGMRMAATLVRPSVVSFLDITGGYDLALRLEEATITAESVLAGRTLAEAQIPQRTGLMVIALQRGLGPDGLHYNPGPETRLAPGDVMMVLGRPDQVSGLRDYVTRGHL